MEGLERKTGEGQERNKGRVGGWEPVVEQKDEKRDRDGI